MSHEVTIGRLEVWLRTDARARGTTAQHRTAAIYSATGLTLSSATADKKTMVAELSPAQKAALTRKRRVAAKKAKRTLKVNNARAKARATETASKEALREHCTERGWRVAFFEGKTGASRTGIIDALAFRLDRRDCDVLQVVVIQLKGGNAGTSGPEIARLKRAASDALVTWAIAEHDGNALHLVPEDRVL